jgi:hypothetical protein
MGVRAVGSHGVCGRSRRAARTIWGLRNLGVECRLKGLHCGDVVTVRPRRHVQRARARAIVFEVCGDGDEPCDLPVGQRAPLVLPRCERIKVLFAVEGLRGRVGMEGRGAIDVPVPRDHERRGPMVVAGGGMRHEGMAALRKEGCVWQDAVDARSSVWQHAADVRA